MSVLKIVKELFRHRAVLGGHVWSRYQRIMKVLDYRERTGCQRIALTTLFSGPPEEFSIGSNSVIRDGARILYKHGRITIGDNVLMSHNVNILAGTHHFMDKETAVLAQPCRFEEICIEDDVWIGANVTIIQNVTIGRGAVIGAMSLVNKDVPPYEVWAGVPARFIKKRGRETT